MALEAKLVQKLSQSLLMTPQLQQAIKLLQLGRLEYQEAIEKELLENPILEEVRDSGESHDPQQTEILTFDGDLSGGDSNPEQLPPGSDSQADWEGYFDSFTDFGGSASPKGTVDFDERPSLEATLTRTETLFDTIVDQVRMLDLSPSEQQIISHIICNLDRNGYLCSTNEELAESANCSAEEIQTAIEHIKSLEPAGLAARDLKECLIFQLEKIGKHEGLEAKIINDHLDKLERHRFDQIAKAEHVSIEEVTQAVQTIRSLEPHPGRSYAEESPRYIVPDIYVQKVGREYVITMNEDGLPKLRISPYYVRILQNADNQVAGGKAYLQERLKAASWLIKSIHQRQQTIYKVTEAIVQFQRDFLDHGIERLKPLVLKDVAQQIGMHESTVSRVTTNKYVHTPQGVFELKYFFTTGIRTEHGEVSSSTIKEKIRTLIAGEVAGNPISDQAIVEILNEQKIDIARRTVAKYREALGIPSSSKRKRLY